jgi:hypothetical protein
MNRELTATLTAVLLGSALSACGGNGSGTLTISARAVSGSAAPAANALQVGGVTIDRVRMVIRDIKLEEEGQEEVLAAGGPFVIDLAGSQLDGGITQQFEVSVPAGNYDDLRFVVHKLEDFERTGDPDIDRIRASIVIDFTMEGVPGQFTSDVNDAQRIAGNFAVTEDGGAPDNITIQIDPSGWFSGGLDPRNAADKQAIEDHIRASIDAFEDDDRDGNDDGPGHT